MPRRLSSSVLLLLVLVPFLTLRADDPPTVLKGEVTQYTELPEDSPKHAIDPMIENARLLGANAVVATRFDSSGIAQQLTEVVAYGTAAAARPAGRPCP